VRGAIKGGLALLLGATLVAACGGDRPSPSSIDAGSDQPVFGGTLRVVGSSDVDHLSTTSAYTTTTLLLLRTTSRQLVGYAPAGGYADATSLVADIALELPTRENGGVSPDGRVYTFRIRPGVRWNTEPPRAVVAGDFVRAFKLFCNPVSPVGAPTYYTDTIRGMQEYCSAFLKVPGTVDAIRQFIDSHELAGVRSPDDSTLVMELLAPTADFLNLMAMMFASAVPVEYLDYLPDSPDFRQHSLSNGPYAITRYIQNRLIELERNPAWDRSSDPINPAYVDRIHVTLGIDPELAQLQIEAGTADMDYSSSMLTVNLSSLRALGDRRVHLFPPGDHYSNMHYLAINVASPNNRGALADLRVRQALALAVDKRALVRLLGGPEVARPLNQPVQSSVSGYREGADRYETPNDQGDPDGARKLLTQAGFPDGLSLRMAFPTSGTFPIEAQAVQASLRRAGFDAQLFAYSSSDLFGRLLPNAQNARRGEWDVAVAGWLPDWYGSSNGRSVFSPLFDGRQLGHMSMNYGLYANPATDAAIDRAMEAATVEDAEAAWSEAARLVMDDVAIVPLVEKKSGYMMSSRIRNCLWTIMGNACDMNALWLDDAVPASGEEKP
jgi:ABC-type transport system substrate-binding protein